MTAPWKHSKRTQEKARKERAKAIAKNQRKEEPEAAESPQQDLVSWSLRSTPHFSYGSSYLTLNGQMMQLLGYDLAPKELPSRQQVEPFVGWKRARLVRINGHVRFYGATVEASYEAEAVADCRRRNLDYLLRSSIFSMAPPAPQQVSEVAPSHEHQAPADQCACGFYAVADQSHWEVLRRDYPDGFARLEVELYGKVIRYTNGYRAEKQRVLAAWVDPACWGCSMWSQVGIERHPGAQMAGMVDAHGLLRPVCAQCAVGLADRLLLSLADISSDLGTEVRWWE